MKTRFTNSLSRAFLSFCILSVASIGSMSAQSSESNLGGNTNVQAGEYGMGSPTTHTQMTAYKNGLIGGKVIEVKDSKVIDYMNQSESSLDAVAPALDPASMQFNIGQGDLSELYKLLALYKAEEAAKGHTVLTRKNQLGTAVDSFPIIRKYVVADDLGGYTPAVASPNPGFMSNQKIAVSQSESPSDLNALLSDNASILEDNNSHLSNSVSLYPNPAKDFISIDLSNISGTDIAIYNIQGKIVKRIESSLNLSQQKIDIADLPSGIYILNVNTPNGQAVKKFSKIN